MPAFEVSKNFRWRISDFFASTKLPDIWTHAAAAAALPSICILKTKNLKNEGKKGSFKIMEHHHEVELVKGIFGNFCFSRQASAYTRSSLRERTNHASHLKNRLVTITKCPPREVTDEGENNEMRQGREKFKLVE